MDLHDGRLDVRKGDVAAGFAPTLDKASLDEIADRLVHCHPGTAVLLRQLVLERNPVARRPDAGEDVPFDVVQDPLVQRQLLGAVSVF
jgi:hypothetical protein